MKKPHRMVTIDFNQDRPKAMYSEFRKKLAQGASTESLEAVAHQYSQSQVPRGSVNKAAVKNEKYLNRNIVGSSFEFRKTSFNEQIKEKMATDATTRDDRYRKKLNRQNSRPVSGMTSTKSYGRSSMKNKSQVSLQPRRKQNEKYFEFQDYQMMAYIDKFKPQQNFFEN